MKKRFVFVTLLLAMVVLTLLPVSLVGAKDIRLKLVSGSDCDPRTQKVVWATYLRCLGIKYKLSENVIQFLVEWYLD